MPLTDTTLRSAKPQNKAFKLFDAGGLSVEIGPARGKWWHWKYRCGGKEKRRFERDIFPWLRGRPIAEVKAPELLAVLRRIESRGAQETAHPAKQNCGQVFRYAVATGRAERDSTGGLRGALPPPKEKHHASITEPKRIGALLRAIDGYEGFFATKGAPCGWCPSSSSGRVN